MSNSSNAPDHSQFAPVLETIRRARYKAMAEVNQQLVDLYWHLGQYISVRVVEGGWGQNTVRELAGWLSKQEPGLRGFSSSNLWRMKQFYETYQGNVKLAAVLREIHPNL